MQFRRSVTLLLVSIGISASVTGCADDAAEAPSGSDVAASTSTAGPASGTAGNTASGTAGDTALCALLRSERNARTDVINELVRGIADRPPAERFTVLVGGFDAVAATVETFADDIEGDPVFAALDEGEAIRVGLLDGTEAALAELDDEQQRFTDDVADGVIPDDDIAGRVGQLFNSVEKVNAALRVDVGALDETAGGRFTDPSCEHVVSASGRQSA